MNGIFSGSGVVFITPKKSLQLLDMLEMRAEEDDDFVQFQDS